MMVYWRGDAESGARPGGRTPPSFPSRAEAVERYASASGRPVDDLGFHVALGYYKLAIISEGIHARFLKGQTVGGGFEGIGSAVPFLVEQGLAALPG
jgi:aminoglycoside phosphotransferase (APT) family kinase protein